MANTLIFYADYTKAGVATAPTSAPTITVYSVNRSSGAEALVGAAGAAMVASALTGRYFYRLTAADLQAYDYHARASTSDSVTGLDARDLPCLWVKFSEAVATNANGQAGVDWGNVGNPTATVDLSATTIAGAGGGGDPWATALPGAYGAGTAGSILGTNLNATVSSRSTYAGGPVASVTAPVALNLAQTGLTPRALDSVADASLTVGDALVAAIAAAAGKESVAGTSYVIRTPSTGTVIRTFTLDSGTAPTSRS
jgi:hypothetical protein